MSISPAEFKATLGRFATGVAVATTCDGDLRAGITVNAFSSLSLDPPLVLICIERSSYVHTLLLRAGVFAVNMLGADQRAVAECFAVRSDRRYHEFCGCGSRVAVSGAPVLDDALAFVDCRVEDVFPGGDHSIIVGRVVALGGAGAAGDPLLYVRGRYTRLDGSSE